MKDLRGQARVTAFLRNSLAEGAQQVLTLEAMARTKGLLGEHQRITHASTRPALIPPTREIDLTHWGVEMARKGGVPKQRILNCLSKEKFAEYLEGRRDQRRGKRSVPRRQIPRTRAVAAGTSSEGRD